jgi:pyruvate-ferredoxin/flavodoxin oxidoreductase
LLHIHAPSPARHGYAADLTLQRARAAVEARVFPLFRYDPQAAGVFGSRLSLDGNPAPREPWHGPPEDGGAFTPAHWALGEGRFADRFEPLAEDAPNPLPVADFLALSDKDRRNKTAFVEQAANGERARRLRVDGRLLQVCGQRLQAWRMLQELAGLVTPFTERVRQEAAQQVAAERQAELAQQARDYEQRIAGLRAELQEQNRRAMRERLMQLAGYRRPQGPPPEPDR